MKKLTKNEIIARVKNCKLAGRGVRGWLVSNYPEEAYFAQGIDRRVTFLDLVRRMFEFEDFYSILNCTDSVQRGKILAALAEETATDYDVWYYLWLSDGVALSREQYQEFTGLVGR